MDQVQQDGSKPSIFDEAEITTEQSSNEVDDRPADEGEMTTYHASIDKDGELSTCTHHDHLVEPKGCIAGHPKGSILCEPCSFDNDTTEASAFCIECTEYICKSCLTDHKKNKMTRSHKVLVEDDIPSSKETFDLLKRIGCCKNHPDKEIEYKCKDHDVYICTVCEGRGHRKCENVEEIQALTRVDEDRDNADSLMKTVEENIDLVIRHNQQNNDNILTLESDLNVVKEEISQTINEINDLLLNLKEQSNKSAECMVKDKVDDLDIATRKGKALIEEYQRESHVLQMAIKYGSPKQIHLVVQQMNDTLASIGQRAQHFKERDQVKLRYSSNMKKLSSFQLGTLDIRDKMSKDEPSDSLNDESEIGSDIFLDDEEKSDAVAHANDGKDRYIESSSIKHLTTQPTDNIPSKSLRDCPLQFIGTHNIRQSTCNAVCCIYGSVCVQDKIILVDNSNSLLVLLHQNFAFKGQTCLPSKPLGICAVDENNVMVILENRKVQRYYVLDGGFVLQNEFNVKLHCRGIARAGTNIAILMSDENFRTEISESDEIEVQVRKVYSGHKVKVVDVFKDKSGKSVKMNDPRCIIYTDDDHILMGEKKYLAEFDKDACRMHFYKSYKDHFISGIRGITADDEGNIYACGYTSNNVHQISPNNFYVNRVIISNIPKPCAIAFDSKRKRLIVSCEASDYIHEYQFTD